MKQGTERLIVLLISFAAFAAGIWALYGESGTWRTVVLYGAFAVLIAVAVRQTIVRRKGKKR